MNNIEWVKIDDVSGYISSGDYSTDEDSCYLARVLYSPKGKKYPLLSISIHRNTEWRTEGFSGIVPSVSFKKKKGAWWDNLDNYASIPFSLINDFKDLLDQAVNK